VQKAKIPMAPPASAGKAAAVDKAIGEDPLPPLAEGGAAAS
jgi:hypothetical protein